MLSKFSVIKKIFLIKTKNEKKNVYKSVRVVHT